MDSLENALEQRIRVCGSALAAKSRSRQSRPGARLDQFLAGMMENPTLRVQVLRFVDVLPALDDDEDLLRHLREYFTPDFVDLARPLKWMLGSRALQGPLLAKAVRRAAGLVSRRFIAGGDHTAALERAEQLRLRSIGFSLDLLGEAVVAETEAERYAGAYRQLIEESASRIARWAPCERLDVVDGRHGPRLHLSLKLTSLCSRIDCADPDGSMAEIGARLRPVFRAARRHRAFVCIDMEQYEYKSLILEIFKTLLLEPEFRDWPDVGIALQAYLRDTEQDLRSLIDWAERRGTAVTVRLVRGAYWDYEAIRARQAGWPLPIWTEKAATDACYERCMDLLLSHTGPIRTAVASHNLRSIAKAMALAEHYGLEPDEFEFQMLYGMADELQGSVAEMGYCLRIYMPVGQPIPGMAYLVRRLLENASNQSLIFSRTPGEHELSRFLAVPAATKDDPEAEDEREITGTLPPFRNEPRLRFISADERESFTAALRRATGEMGKTYPLIIDGREIDTGRYFDSVNPARPGQRLGRVAKGGREEADRAVRGAAEALVAWSESTVDQRAAVLLRSAALLRGRRAEFAAREILEAGKTWREADANITETIDFLEYYARQAIRLGRGRRADVPGELNFSYYRPCGVGVVIPPWNFPSAILMGMLSAAIVTGNTAVLKPSSQTPVIAAHLVNLLREAGLPPGVVQFLPGAGSEVGEYLVGHPGVHFAAFTGSEAVGTRILAIAAERTGAGAHVKRVVAEMGGKNAIIADTDADPDEVVKGVVHSAFGYQGQKCSACSRLIMVGRCHDSLVKRLADAASSLKIDRPDRPGTFMGPVIEAAARDRIEAAIEAGRGEADLVYRRECTGLGEGYFVGPAIFREASPDSTLAQKEIFGPVLTLFRAASLDDALAMANHSRYALTGGFYSRSPAHIERVKREFRVGNLYINREITGALVNRQPFGGFRMSGLGYKAGGPDYLLQFMNQAAWTENTLRHGFAPDEGCGT